MKNLLLTIALAMGVVASHAAPSTAAPVALEPAPQQIQAAAMTAELLTRFHYTPMALDDAMSQKTFDRYVKSMDPERLFFLQSDIDQFTPARDKLDDAIKSRDLTTPFAMFNLYQRRVQERLVYGRALLDQQFDFGQQESYAYQRRNEAWARTDAEVRDLWRRRVKNDWLRLKLTGKDDAAIRTTLAKRYDNALANTKRLKSEDVFQLFMNAYATSVEPHTNYLGPKATADFDISMRLSLVGIGAVLQERDDMTVIRELVPGGPAARSGKLKVGDRIVAVGQASDSALTDVLGWRLDDVVQLIRGAEDSVVKMSILPADANLDAPQQVVSLVRKKVTLEQQAAKKSVIEVKDGSVTRRIGVISLPAFYQDYEARKKGDKAFKSATRDVASLLDALKIERTHFVGLSMGGMIGQHLALTAPQRLDKLVIANSTSRIPPEAGPLWDERIAIARSQGCSGLVEGTLGRWFTPAFRTANPAQTERIGKLIADTPPTGFIGCASAIRALDISDRINAITTPTLVIAGADDPGTPPAMSEVIAGKIAGARYAVIPAASHLSCIEQPASFLALVADFLRQ